MKREGQGEGRKDRRMPSCWGQLCSAVQGDCLPHGLGSHIPSKGAKHPWGAVEGTQVTWGQPLVGCCSGPCWARAGGAAALLPHPFHFLAGPATWL